MRILPLAAALAVTVTASAAFAQSAPAAAPAGHYDVATTPLGTLLDDPAAKAVLVKDIPETVNNPQIDMARSMTLKDIQQYAQGTLSDATLAKIQAELAALPAKN